MRTQGYRCPYCDCDELPRRETRISTAGWIVLILLLLFFPINLIGLFLRDTYHVCPDCGLRVD